MPYSLNAFSTLMDQVYTAASQPGQWQAMLASLARLTGSSSACLSCSDGPSTDIASDHRVPRELQQEYADTLAPIDRLGRTARRIPDFVGVTSDIFKRHPELHVPEFEYRAQYYGLTERWGANLSANVGIGLHRTSGMEPYSAESKRFLAHLLPHLRNAVAIHERLAQARRQRDGLLECIASLGLGVILLDGFANVTLINPRAEMILGEATSLHIIHDRLHSLQRNNNHRLQQILARVASGDRPVGCMRLSDSLQPLEILVSPFAWPREDTSAAAPTRSELVVFVSEPEQCIDMSVDILRQLYGLTPAEADTLNFLANDFGVSDIARIQQISVHTVRSHLYALRAKTGARNQSGLMKVALTSTARLIKSA